MQFLKEYQGFSLNLSEIARMLGIISNGITDKQSQLSESGFGDNKVRGIKEYLKDLGLLESKNQLTTVGRLIVENDRRFREYISRWILLYNWSLKENNPFLNFLIFDYKGEGEDEDIIRRFKQWSNRNEVKTDYEGTKLSGLINKTKSALTDSEAFRDLNLYINSERLLIRSDPYYVHPFLIAYILFENRKGRTSISFRELLEERNNFPRFFNYNSKELDTIIVELMNLGFVKMVQHADLHMIEFKFSGTSADILQRYYDEY